MPVKALKCELCNGDLVKQGDGFVCEYCGTKYSLEEAKKLLVEIDGTVKVDGDVGVKGNVGIQKTATVVGGMGPLKYCTHCGTNINAESHQDPLGICVMFAGMVLGFILFLSVKPFSTGMLVGTIFFIAGIVVGAILMSKKKWRCPFCRNCGSGNAGSVISPPRLNQ